MNHFAFAFLLPLTLQSALYAEDLTAHGEPDIELSQQSVSADDSGVYTYTLTKSQNSDLTLTTHKESVLCGHTIIQIGQLHEKESLDSAEIEWCHENCIIIVCKTKSPGLSRYLCAFIKPHETSIENIASSGMITIHDKVKPELNLTHSLKMICQVPV